MDPNTKQQFQIVQSSAGAQLADSTARTSLLHSTGKLTIPKNSLYQGKGLLIRASGSISNVVTTPGTFKFDLDAYDGTNHVNIASSQAMALNVVAKSNVGWYLEWLLTVRAIGAAATVIHQGKFTSESVVGSPLPSAGGAGTLSIPASSPAVGSSFDSTLDNVLDLFGTFSVNTAGTNITVQQFSIMSIG